MRQSPIRASWHLGLGSVLATTSRAASAKAAQPPRATRGARQTLVEFAWSASPKKDSEPQRFYEGLHQRLKHKPRTGGHGALVDLEIVRRPGYRGAIRSRPPRRIDTRHGPETGASPFPPNQAPAALANRASPTLCSKYLNVLRRRDIFRATPSIGGYGFFARTRSGFPVGVGGGCRRL
jgi:hypothetical protein